jgi:hypothetical protein
MKEAIATPSLWFAALEDNSSPIFRLRVAKLQLRGRNADEIYSFRRNAISLC